MSYLLMLCSLACLQADDILLRTDRPDSVIRSISMTFLCQTNLYSVNVQNKALGKVVSLNYEVNSHKRKLHNRDIYNMFGLGSVVGIEFVRCVSGVEAGTYKAELRFRLSEGMIHRTLHNVVVSINNSGITRADHLLGLKPKRSK